MYTVECLSNVNEAVAFFEYCLMRIEATRAFKLIKFKIKENTNF